MINKIKQEIKEALPWIAFVLAAGGTMAAIGLAGKLLGLGGW